MATKTAKTANKPAHEIRSGAIRAVIWHNSSDKGNWYSVNITRSYKAGDTWKETSQFNRDDLLAVSKLCDLAFSWIQQQPAKAE
ncbi:MAG: hypothetical protein R3C09_27555 [Pirellulaceae bacterium]